MGDRHIRPTRAMPRLRLVRRTPAAPPEPSAWLRRYPAGGWTLKVGHHGSAQQRLVGTIVEAAELISDLDDVTRVHLWSSPSATYVELELMSLAPLLEASRTARPA